jgi:hypothetical protein
MLFSALLTFGLPSALGQPTLDTDKLITRAGDTGKVLTKPLVDIIEVCNIYCSEIYPSWWYCSDFGTTASEKLSPNAWYGGRTSFL